MVLLSLRLMLLSPLNCIGTFSLGKGSLPGPRGTIRDQEGPLGAFRGLSGSIKDSRGPVKLCLGVPAPFPGHPLAQRPHVQGLLGLKGLKYQGFGSLRHHFGGSSDVEGLGRLLWNSGQQWNSDKTPALWSPAPGSRYPAASSGSARPTAAWRDGPQQGPGAFPKLAPCGCLLKASAFETATMS